MPYAFSERGSHIAGRLDLAELYANFDERLRHGRAHPRHDAASSQELDGAHHFHEPVRDGPIDDFDAGDVDNDETAILAHDLGEEFFPHHGAAPIVDRADDGQDEN